jgi:diadenosine tetraphosphate (Ap4A) HIT family hydrolase
MKMRLAGLRFVIGGHLHIHILPGVCLAVTHFSFVLLASTKTIGVWSEARSVPPPPVRHTQEKNAGVSQA